MKTKNIKNVFIGSYGSYENLTDRDKRSCQEDGEPYSPSELTLAILEYVDDKGYLDTKFETLKTISKIIENWGLSLMIEPSGNICFYDTDY